MRENIEIEKLSIYVGVQTLQSKGLKDRRLFISFWYSSYAFAAHVLLTHLFTENGDFSG